MKNTDQAVITLQSSPFWNERRESAFTLGRCTEPKARETLVNALKDQDDDVLQAVIIALGNIGEEKAIDQMLLPRYLNHPNAHIRWATLKALGQIGKLCFSPEIAELTNDEEWIVRNEAIKLLRNQSKFVLENRSVETARQMISLLTTHNQELRNILIDTFLGLGSKIKPTLQNFLKTGGPQIKAAIAFILGKLKDNDSVDDLIDLLMCSNREIQKNAIEALGLIGNKSAIPALIEEFGNSSRDIQQQAIAAVARFEDAALPHLHEKIRYSSRKTIKQNTLFALTKINNESSIPYFIEHLGSTYFIVRRAAISGLVQYGDKVIPRILNIIRNVKLPIIEDLLKQSEDGETINIRVRAIKALGALADHRAVHLLKRLAASKEIEIQKASLKSLAEVGCACWQRCGALAVFRELRIAPDIELIIEQLKDDSENVRSRAIQVLARGKNQDAVPTLLQTASDDSNMTLRYEALRAADELAPADTRVINEAVKILKDASVTTQLKAEAVRVIGRSLEESHIAPLVECLKTPSWEIRRNAALALGNIGKTTLPPLLERLHSENDIELESVIRAIGNVGSSKSIPAIQKAIERFAHNSPVRFAASKALTDINSPKIK
jgi:HEAT repeat protein